MEPLHAGDSLCFLEKMYWNATINDYICELLMNVIKHFAVHL